jgi:hypothetical protein
MDIQQASAPIGAGLGQTEAENLIIAEFAGNPEWAWAIEIKHRLAARMNGDQFYSTVSDLVSQGRLDRRLQPGRGFLIRIAAPKVDPRAGGVDVSASEGGAA